MSRARAISNPSMTTPPASSAELGAATSEYSIFGLRKAVDDAAARSQRRKFTLLVFGAATLIAVLYSAERYTVMRLSGEQASLRNVVTGELLFTYAWALLTPLVMAFARRYPVWGHQPQARNWVAQIGGLAAFVVAHNALYALGSTTIMLSMHMPWSFSSRFEHALLSWTVLDSLVFCALVAVHQAVLYYRVSKDRSLRTVKLEARLAQAQLQMLRMQLQPHFLFNTLHSISALMHKDVERADSMVAALSDLLRMSLQNIGAQEVPLQSELDFLQRYVEIMTLRFGDRLNVAIEVDEAARDARVPNLFLQPLVENSFRHGFGDVGMGHVRITVRREGAMLRCEVVDDGRGMRAGQHKDGVGLTSTRQRLEHLYGSRHTFAIRGAPGQGVHVTMAIPFTPYGQSAAD